MSRRPVVIVVLVVVGLMIVAVWGWRSGPDRPEARIGSVSEFDCPEPTTYNGGLSSASVPDEFEPVAAVTCDPWFGERVDAELGASFEERRWEGDFGPVVTLLNSPSESPSWFDGTCGTYSLARIDYMWLIDADGRAIEAGYPTASCGWHKVGGLAAVQELTEVATVSHHVQLSPEQVEDIYGCSTVVSPAVEGASTPTYTSIGSTFCRFSAGRFVGTVTGEISIDGLSLAPRCSTPAREIATALYGDRASRQMVTVEFDGCRRVVVDGYAPLRATEELMQSFG